MHLRLAPADPHLGELTPDEDHTDAPPGSTLSVRRIFRATFRTWRRDAVYLTLLAAAAYAPVILVKVLYHRVTGHYPGVEEGFHLSLNDIPVTVLGMLTHHLLSGAMEAVEGEERHGHPRPTPIQLARSLPWKRLILADIIVNSAIWAGMVLLVVPGIAIATYTAIVPPLLNMERRPIVATIRRSIELVRPFASRVTAVWLVVGVVVKGIHELFGETAEALFHSEQGEFFGELIGELLFLPPASLPIVMLAFELVALDQRRRAPAPAPAPSADGR